MISISAFKAFPEIPELAYQNNLKLEFSGLVEPIAYSDELIKSVTDSKYHDLYNSAHGPFLDLIPPSNDGEVRALAKTKFIRAIKAAEQLRIPNVILHTGWIPNFYTDDKWIANSIHFWTDLMRDAPEGITICLENVMERTPTLIHEIINGVNNPRFMSCLDIGHVNVFDGGKITDWLKMLNTNIKHIHLHNNYGTDDNHNGLAKGNIDIGEAYANIKTYSPDATINLEIRSDIVDSINIIRRIEKNYGSQHLINS